MTTELFPIDGSVNLLRLGGVTLLTLDVVDSWLCAIDLPQEARNSAHRQILGDGYYAVSNIEYRVTVECTSNIPK